MTQVSVIVPVYNAEKYLWHCLNSLIGQTFKGFEVICINDGSTDESIKFLNHYAKKDNRIKIINTENKGAGNARNIGLQAAKGKYLAFLDADDFYHSNFLEKMLEQSIKTNSDVTVCAVNRYEITSFRLSHIRWSLMEDYLPQKEVFSYKDMPKYVFNTFQNWNWNKLFNHDFVKNNNITFQNLYRTNDLLFTCKALVLANKISVVRNFLVNYRCGMDTNSQKNNHLYPLDFYEALKTLKQFLCENNFYNDVEQSFINLALSNCVYNLDSLNDDTIKQKVVDFLLNNASKDLALDLTTFPESYIYNNERYVKYKEYLKLS